MSVPHKYKISDDEQEQSQLIDTFEQNIVKPLIGQIASISFRITDDNYHESQMYPTICPYELTRKFDTDNKNNNQDGYFHNLFQTSRITYLIPVHYTFTINNINEIFVEKATAQVNAILTLGISYKYFQKMGKPELKDIIHDNLKIELSNKQDISLNSSNNNVQFIDNTKDQMLIFIVRKDFVGLLCEQNVWWTPLQSLFIVFSIQLRNIDSQQILFENPKCKLKKQTNQHEQFDFKSKQTHKTRTINSLYKKNYSQPNIIQRQRESMQQPRETRMIKSSAFKQPFSIKFNLLNFKKNRQENAGNLGSQIFVQKDQLTIGQYQICTTKSISQVSMYRVPFLLAKYMNLQIVHMHNELSYKQLVNSEQVKKQICIQQKIGKQQYSPKQIESFYYQQLKQQTAMLQSISKQSNIEYNIKSFRLAHVSINVFRHPIVAIVGLIFPLMAISLLNLGVFWIDVGGDEQSIKRITVIVTSLVAFIGLIPVVRSKIPPTDQLTLIQALVLAELIPSILAMVELLRFSNTKQTTKYIYTIQFKIGCSVTIIVLLVCIGIVLYFYCFKLKNYRYQFQNEVNPQAQQFLCDEELWESDACKRYLTQLKWVFGCRQQQIQKQKILRRQISRKIVQYSKTSKQTHRK